MNLGVRDRSWGRHEGCCWRTAEEVRHNAVHPLHQLSWDKTMLERGLPYLTGQRLPVKAGYCLNNLLLFPICLAPNEVPLGLHLTLQGKH